MLTVYGIKQCDTCRKALKWLKDAGVEHRFHDLRADGLQDEQLAAWLDSRQPVLAPQTVSGAA